MKGSSHFSVGKRTLTPLKRGVPIDHTNDPAVGKAVDDDAVEQWARAVAAAAIEDGDVEVLRHLAQQTGVKQCDKVNCPPARVCGRPHLIKEGECWPKPWDIIGKTMATCMCRGT